MHLRSEVRREREFSKNAMKQARLYHDAVVAVLPLAVGDKKLSAEIVHRRPEFTEIASVGWDVKYSEGEITLLHRVCALACQESDVLAVKLVAALCTNLEGRDKKGWTA